MASGGREFLLTDLALLITNQAKRWPVDIMIFNIKNFPVDLHRKAKAAAALEGKSLKDWVVEAMKEKLERSKSSTK